MRVFFCVSGERPKLIEGCPKPIENLMTSCWDPAPINRPSMEYVVEVMTILCEHFPGADEPIVYNNSDDTDVCNDEPLCLVVSETESKWFEKCFHSFLH